MIRFSDSTTSRHLPLPSSLSSITISQSYPQMLVDKENRQNVQLSEPLNLPLKATNNGCGAKTESGEMATLVCGKLQQGVFWVGFGCVPLNTTSCREFRLYNPESQAVSVSIDKCPTKKGFSMFLGEKKQRSVTIGPFQSSLGYINWTPTENLSVREVAILALNGKHKLSLTFHGVAGIGTSKVIIGKDNSRNGKKSAVHKVAKKNVLQGQKSNVLKKAGREMVNKNDLQQKCPQQSDNKTSLKHSSMLIKWINEKMQQELPCPDPCDAFKSIEYCRAEESNRNDLYLVLHHEDTITVLDNIEKEVISNKMALRPELNVRANVAFKDGVLDMLLCYDPVWLKSGLESVFGIKISIPAQDESHKNSVNRVEAWKSTLRKSIQENLLSCGQIEKQYLSTSNIMTPQIESKLQESIRHHILTKILTLIYVLDEARMNCMCNGRLTLFQVTSSIKSSKGILAELCRNFLHAEGDFYKHLKTLGYSVEFYQTPVHEYDFSCSDIKNDMRDGVRLARLADLLAHSNDQKNLLSSKMRVPAVSRLQKLHNVGVTLKFLQEKGINFPIDGKAVVEGNLDATQLLLWKMIFEFDLKFVVSIEEIKAEATRISKTFSSDCNSEELSFKTETDDYFSQIQFHLLQWCKNIAQKHLALKTSVWEGIINAQILCTVVHHYYPSILPLDAIKDNTDCSGSTDKYIICSLESTSQKNKSSVRRANLLTLSRALKAIGGVPFMLPTEAQADERTLVLFLGFLFSRLVLSSRQIKAAALIQKKIRSRKKAKFPASMQKAEDIGIEIYESKRNSSNCLTEKSLQNFNLTKAIQQKEQVEASVVEIDNKENSSSNCQERLTEVDASHSNCDSTEEDAYHGQESIIEADASRNDCQESQSNNAQLNTNLHKMCLTELVHKMKIKEALKSETLGRLAAEEKLREMKKFFEASISSAELAQRNLEEKLATEIKAREMEQIEKEVAMLDAMIDEADRKLIVHSKEHRAALVLQRLGKKLLRLAANKTLLMAVCKIQALSRRQRVRNNYILLRSSAIKIQQRARILIEKQLHNRKVLIACNTIQRWTRHVLMIKEQSRQQNASAVIQCFIMSRISRRRFLIMKDASSTISRAFRRKKNHTLCKRKTSAHIVISALVFFRYKRWALKRRSAFCLQIQCRRWITRKKEFASKNVQELRREQAASVIVRLFRKIKSSQKLKRAASSIETWFRAVLPLLRARKLSRGFVRLQALRRSLIVRRKSSKTIKAAFAKIKVVNAQAASNPDLKLSARTKVALMTLQKGKMVSHCLKACQTLELSTSYSLRCCSNFVAASASKILFTLIRSCNRSTPHQELLRCALSVLINVTRDKQLAANVVHNGDTTELLVDLMQMFRDKKVIFNLSCELLSRLVQAQEDIKVECLTNDMKKRLDGIMHILERKHRLDMRVKKFSKVDQSNLSPKSDKYMALVPPFELMDRFMSRLRE